jgi:hypothetical protein
VTPPVVPGYGGDRLKIQKSLEIKRAVARQAPALWDIISEINLSRPETPLLFLSPEGCQVKLGRGDLDTQIRRLWIVLSDLASRGTIVKKLDLRYKDQLICQTAS